MDKTDARLKADRIDIQLDPVESRSDTQKLIIYNMSSRSQKMIYWALAGNYFLTLLITGIQFLSLTGVININSTVAFPKPL